MLLTLLLTDLALPALVAFGATGLIIYARKRGPRPQLAELGLGIGFLAGFWAVTGGLPFLDKAAYHPLGEAVAVAILGGVLLATIGTGPRLMAIVAVVGALGTMMWLVGWPKLTVLPLSQLLMSLVAAGVGTVTALRARDLGPGATPVAVTALAALALALIAAIAHAAAISALALVLMGACIGRLVWAWPLARASFGPSALAVLVAGFSGLMVEEAQGSLNAPWPLLPLPLAFWSATLVRHLPVVDRLARKKPSRPWALLIAASLPCCAGVALALLLAGGAR